MSARVENAGGLAAPLPLSNGHQPICNSGCVSRRKDRRMPKGAQLPGDRAIDRSNPDNGAGKSQRKAKLARPETTLSFGQLRHGTGRAAEQRPA